MVDRVVLCSVDHFLVAALRANLLIRATTNQ